MVLGEHMVSHLVMILLIYAQTKYKKFSMLLSNLRNFVNITKYYTGKMKIKFTHVEYLKWSTELEPECPINHEG